jgi:predicted RNase H-like HicB family nuclease
VNIDAHDYNIRIRRGEIEGETLFEARVKELPDLIEYGETFDDAYDLALDAIETTARIFAEKRRLMPVPAAQSDGQ